MKHAPKLIAALLLASSLSVVYAQTPAERPTASPPQTPHGDEMMRGGMGMQGMQNLMGKMQEQMAKLRSTSDPAERQKLMAEHMSTMQEAMVAMMKMGPPGTGMMPMMKGRSDKSSTPPGRRDMQGRMGMMEQRMDMMQMMMNQMMQHQDMREHRQ